MALPQNVFTTQPGDYLPWFNVLQSTTAWNQPSAVAPGQQLSFPFTVSVSILQGQGDVWWGINWQCSPSGALGTERVGFVANWTVQFLLQNKPIVTYPVQTSQPVQSGTTVNYQPASLYIPTQPWSTGIPFTGTSEQPLIMVQEPAATGAGRYIIPCNRMGGYKADTMRFSGVAGVIGTSPINGFQNATVFAFSL